MGEMLRLEVQVGSVSRWGLCEPRKCGADLEKDEGYGANVRRRLQGGSGSPFFHDREVARGMGVAARVGTMESVSPSSQVRYVFSARQRDGSRRYVEVRAGNVGAARHRLEVQGHEGLELVEDDLDDKISRAISSEETFADLSLQERMEFQKEMAGPKAGRFLLWYLVKSEGGLVLAIGFGVWWAAHRANPLSFWSLTAYALAVGYGFLLLRARVPAVLYDRLLEVRAWHRWEEVEREVARIRRWRWLIGAPIPEYELLFSEARALAGRGNLGAAKAKVRQLEEDPAFDRGLYYGLLAGVCELGLDFAGRVEYAEKALALNPASAANQIDLVNGLITNGEIARAKAVLAEVDEADLKPLVRTHYLFGLGCVALLEGVPQKAEGLLRKAVEGALENSGNLLGWGFAQEVRGCHALALRRSGRREEAEMLWKEVEGYLVATPPRPVVGWWREDEGWTRGVVGR